MKNLLTLMILLFVGFGTYAMSDTETNSDDVVKMSVDDYNVDIAGVDFALVVPVPPNVALDDIVREIPQTETSREIKNRNERSITYATPLFRNPRDGFRRSTR